MKNNNKKYCVIKKQMISPSQMKTLLPDATDFNKSQVQL